MVIRGIDIKLRFDLLIIINVVCFMVIRIWKFIVIFVIFDNFELL